MAQFDSVQFGNGKKILDKIFRALAFQGNSDPNRTRRVCTGDGVPTDDATAFDPIQAGTFYYDYTNDDVYICTAYVSTSSFTYTKISL